MIVYSVDWLYVRLEPTMDKYELFEILRESFSEAHLALCKLNAIDNLPKDLNIWEVSNIAKHVDSNIKHLWKACEHYQRLVDMRDKL